MFYIQSNEIRENIEKIYCIFLLAHFGFSISYNFLISGQNTECGYAFLNFIVRNILVIKLPGDLLNFSVSLLQLLWFQLWKTDILCNAIVNI